MNATLLNHFRLASPQWSEFPYPRAKSDNQGVSQEDGLWMLVDWAVRWVAGNAVAKTNMAELSRDVWGFLALYAIDEQGEMVPPRSNDWHLDVGQRLIGPDTDCEALGAGLQRLADRVWNLSEADEEEQRPLLYSTYHAVDHIGSMVLFAPQRKTRWYEMLVELGAAIRQTAVFDDRAKYLHDTVFGAEILGSTCAMMWRLSDADEEGWPGALAEAMVDNIWNALKDRILAWCHERDEVEHVPSWADIPQAYATEEENELVLLYHRAALGYGEPYIQAYSNLVRKKAREEWGLRPNRRTARKRR